MMGLFEENPWLLVPIIIVTMEVWNLVKAFLKDAWLRHKSRSAV